jgi:hypothetical protein
MRFTSDSMRCAIAELLAMRKPVEPSQCLGTIQIRRRDEASWIVTAIVRQLPPLDIDAIEKAQLFPSRSIVAALISKPFQGGVDARKSMTSIETLMVQPFL